MIEVSAALIRNEAGEYLICQRPRNKGMALLWEFPGGKAEPGETGPDCLVRECQEELALEVLPGPPWHEVTDTSWQSPVRIRFYPARILAGAPLLREHRGILWATPQEMAALAFCPADRGLVARLMKEEVL